jgi:hypothetical protein
VVLEPTKSQHTNPVMSEHAKPQHALVVLEYIESQYGADSWKDYIVRHHQLQQGGVPDMDSCNKETGLVFLLDSLDRFGLRAMPASGAAMDQG